jgi:F420-dependent methylenetetrahydromethanopterin dehydrogenase
MTISIIKRLLIHRCDFDRMSSDKTFNDLEFAKRIARVRARFASKLADKIQATEATSAHMADEGSEAVAAVATAYGLFHDMYGIASTIGFQTTGQMARVLDAVLISPYRERRGLRGDELSKLKAGLEALRIAARTEMQIEDRDQE